MTQPRNLVKKCPTIKLILLGRQRHGWGWINHAFFRGNNVIENSNNTVFLLSETIERIALKKVCHSPKTWLC